MLKEQGLLTPLVFIFFLVGITLVIHKLLIALNKQARLKNSMCDGKYPTPSYYPHYSLSMSGLPWEGLCCIFLGGRGSSPLSFEMVSPKKPLKRPLISQTLR